MRYFAVLLVLAACCMVGVHADPWVPVPRCPADMDWANLAQPGNCKWECPTYRGARKDIQKQLKIARKCDPRSHQEKKQFWRDMEESLLEKYACKTKFEGVLFEKRLCISSALVMELTNVMYEHCSPDLYDEVYVQPEVKTGVLKCAYMDTYPFNTPRSFPVVEIIPVGCLQKKACKHHFAVTNGNAYCSGMCVSKLCSSDFLFDYCVKVTTSSGLTNPECTEDMMTRASCFSS